MAINIPTKITNSLDGYLLDAENVKGTYLVVNSYEELANLPEATIVDGSLAYCQTDYSTYSAGLYKYNGSSWESWEIGVGAATYNDLGGVKLGSATQSSQTIETASSTAGRQYPVQVDSNGRASVNVPWTDTTYENKQAVNGGTDVSLVTTGDKYIWNNKQNTLTAGTNISIQNNVISAIDHTVLNGVAYREI